MSNEQREQLEEQIAQEHNIERKNWLMKKLKGLLTGRV
jgi:hypothetical protein